MYAKAVQMGSFFTVDASKKPGEGKMSLRLSPVGSVFKILFYTIIDYIIAVFLPCLFGCSLMK